MSKAKQRMGHYSSSVERRKMRNRLAEAQNWRCCYCGRRLEPETATLEHVIPASAGGTHCWENLAASCRPCNQSRPGPIPIASPERDALAALMFPKQWAQVANKLGAIHLRTRLRRRAEAHEYRVKP